ncbi:MAG: 50S ribosomal protein L29 [Bradymonadia bacterium]
MKASELREKSVAELREMSDAERKALFDLRFQHYTGQLMDTASLSRTRRNIARLETVIRELELAQSAQ